MTYHNGKAIKRNTPALVVKSVTLITSVALGLVLGSVLSGLVIGAML